MPAIAVDEPVVERRAGGRRPRFVILLALVGATGAGGCQRTLFPEQEPRTQYEKYDLMRNRYTPAEEPDVFGNPQPALRARLAPRD